MSKPKILFVGAMDREIRNLLSYFQCVKYEKIQKIYPYWLAKKDVPFELAVLQTHVGDTNAGISTTLALQKYHPDFVFKIGCVGANSKGIHTGDVLLPLGFFHTGSWITRSNKDNTPTANASLWQSVFGEKPYQVNSENLGQQPYFLKPDLKLVQQYKKFFTNGRSSLVPCYIGGGNMWFFDLKFMENVSKTQIPGNIKEQPWGADMESYAIVQACHVFHTPFMGFYRISNSDYYNEPYVPEKVANLFDDTYVSKIHGFLVYLVK